VQCSAESLVGRCPTAYPSGIETTEFKSYFMSLHVCTNSNPSHGYWMQQTLHVGLNVFGRVSTRDHEDHTYPPNVNQ